MRVIVTGSREWAGALARNIIRTRLQDLPEDTVIIHGGCRGVDKIADDIADGLGFPRAVYPADWQKHGKAAGPMRNERMLLPGADLVLAFHDDLENSRGTKDMVDRARKAGIPVEVIA